MNTSFLDIEQGSDAWRRIRLGKLTASRIADALTRTKTGWGASRANLMAALIAERLTGMPQESYTNSAMQHGIETEPEARAAYEFWRNVDVQQVGFVLHPSIADAGCSPDGLVGERGLLELKCPNTSTHIDTLIGRTVPDRYIKQALWQMACTGREWVDYASYDSRMPEAMRLLVIRIDRDDAKIAELEREAVEFLRELQEKMQRLTDAYAPEPAREMAWAG